MRDWNPYKRTEGGDTNINKARAARLALISYTDNHKDVYPEDISELIASICHLCDQQGIDAIELIMKARGTWARER